MSHEAIAIPACVVGRLCACPASRGPRRRQEAADLLSVDVRARRPGRQPALCDAGKNACRCQADYARQGVPAPHRDQQEHPSVFAAHVQPDDRAAGPGRRDSLGPSKTTYNDDIISGWVGIGSQLDGLGHVGIDNVYYNCNKAADFVKADGLGRLGIEHVPAVTTRAVLLDMAGFFNTDIVKEVHRIQPRRDRGGTAAPGRDGY